MSLRMSAHEGGRQANGVFAFALGVKCGKQSRWRQPGQLPKLASGMRLVCESTIDSYFGKRTTTAVELTYCRLQPQYPGKLLGGQANLLEESSLETPDAHCRKRGQCSDAVLPMLRLQHGDGDFNTGINSENTRGCLQEVPEFGIVRIVIKTGHGPSQMPGKSWVDLVQINYAIPQRSQSLPGNRRGCSRLQAYAQAGQFRTRHQAYRAPVLRSEKTRRLLLPTTPGLERLHGCAKVDNEFAATVRIDDLDLLRWCGIAQLPDAADVSPQRRGHLELAIFHGQSPMRICSSQCLWLTARIGHPKSRSRSCAR